ncbi:MAG: ATP-dependent Clp protease ATP-binding subunit [Clostridiales bacterium]|nr:ATP-dependent Clp protease ATP-binding subunit [Clostridiales bacterium]
MPPGCRPSQVQLGFWQTGGDYLLYFRPAVSYAGDDPLLREFFSRGPVQRFSGFQALADCLGSLAGSAPAPAIPFPDLLPRLERRLQSRVLGQDQAVEAAAFKLWGHVCKREPLRPLSLIFYGPTGVGKSELGKAVAPALNDCLGQDRYRLVWTELNTFTEGHSVYRLTGAPPGYVGYDDPAVLEAVRLCPHTVFMFDELDKAHPQVLKALMSVLDEGRCTARREDGQGGRELDFRRCVFLFTTNTDLSAPAGPRLGFAPPPAGAANESPLPSPAVGGLPLRLFRADESARLALARSGVLREIAGRFSGLIGFRPLDGDARAAVTARQIAALGREYGLDIAQVSPAIARALTPRGAVSPRSTVPVLEGVLTPVLLAQAPLLPPGTPLRLTGTVEHMSLIPA